MNEANNRFAKWMEASFISDKDVAEKMDTSEQYIYMLRKDHKNISDGFKWRFAKVYGYEFAIKLLDSEQEPVA